MALSPERQREIQEEEQLRIDVQKRQGWKRRQIGCASAFMLVIGVVLALYFAGQPQPFPLWLELFLGAAVLLFLVSRAK